MNKKILAAILLCVCSINLSFAKVFVYELPDGSRLITDKRVTKKGYTLKKTYQTTSYRGNKKKATYQYSTIKSKHDALIIKTALAHNVEPSFIKAIIHTESHFNQYAVSRAGAMGLMQLMPATANRFHLSSDYFNPQKNIKTGIKYLKTLMKRYKGDQKLILAAYNAGEGAVDKYKGIPPYAETQQYVKRVLKLYRLYKKEI